MNSPPSTLERPHAERMQVAYCGLMSEVRSVIVQVRDMPEDVVDTLKARAEARGQSLSAYLRDLLTQEARMPLIEEVMAQIAQDEPIDYTVEDIRAYIEEDRR